MLIMFNNIGGSLVVKSRKEFNTEDEYLEYVATPEFMEKYSIEHKTVDEIVSDMRLPEEWMPFIEKVYRENIKKKRYEGIYFYYDVEMLVIENEDYELAMDKLERNKKEGGDV